jgi:hypothetical protein
LRYPSAAPAAARHRCWSAEPSAAALHRLRRRRWRSRLPPRYTGVEPIGGIRGRHELRDDEPRPPSTFPSQGSPPGAAAPSGSGWPPWLSAASPLAVVSLLGEHAKGSPRSTLRFSPLTRAPRPSGCRCHQPPEPPGSSWPRCGSCPREEDWATLRITLCEKVNFPDLFLCLANLAETP